MCVNEGLVYCYVDVAATARPSTWKFWRKCYPEACWCMLRLSGSLNQCFLHHIFVLNRRFVSPSIYRQHWNHGHLVDFVLLRLWYKLDLCLPTVWNPRPYFEVAEVQEGDKVLWLSVEFWLSILPLSDLCDLWWGIQGDIICIELFCLPCCAFVRFPIWIMNWDNISWYGMPIHGIMGVKAAMDSMGASVTAGTRSFTPNPDNTARTDAFVKKFFPKVSCSGRLQSSSEASLL